MLASSLISSSEIMQRFISLFRLESGSKYEKRELRDMQQTLGKILQKHQKVAMYLCGHIHNFQHLQVKGSSIDYIVNSSASLSRKVNPIEGTIYCSPETGFSVIAADKSELCLHMINNEGIVLHSVKKQK